MTLVDERLAGPCGKAPLRICSKTSSQFDKRGSLYTSPGRHFNVGVMG